MQVESNFPVEDRGRRSGFSLIEMLIVLGVIGLLLAFSAPSLFSVMTASSLSGEGVTLQNQLTFAQQVAVSKSADVEIRFFKVADEAAAQTEEAYRAYQLYQFNREGEMVPVSSFFRIKPPVAISEVLSTVLKPSTQASQEDEKFGFTSPRTGSERVPMGPSGELRGADYVSFRFRPDGSTDLPFRALEGDDTWYITLVQGEGAVKDSNPTNFVTLQVNAYNGQVSSFRP